MRRRWSPPGARRTQDLLSWLDRDVIAILWRWWAAMVGVVVLPMIPLLSGRSSGISDDLHRFSLPYYEWVWRTIFDGAAPWWSPWAFAGHNVAGSGQAAIFYPPNVVFGLFDVVAVFPWWFVGHLVIAATGMFLWSWRCWRSKPGASVSGIAYGLNGIAILHIVHPGIVASMAWMPWILLGVDLVIERWTTRRALALIVPLSLCVFAGHVQSLYFVLLAMAVYTVIVPRAPWPDLMAWLRVGTAAAVGLGIGAVQLLPQLAFSRTSERPALTPDEAFLYSAQARHLLTSIIPHIMGGGHDLPGLSGQWLDEFPIHETANHAGIVTVALALIAVAVAWRHRRLMALSVIAVVAALMALAGTTPFGDLAFEYLPLADRFRVWPRTMILLNLAVSCAAGAGVRVVLSATRHRRERMGTGLAVGCLVIVALVAVTNFDGARVSGTALGAVMAFAGLCVGLLAIAIVMAGRHRDLAAGLIVGAVAVNMVVFAAGAPWMDPDLTLAEAEAYFDPSTPSPTDPYPAPGGVSRWMSDNTRFKGLETIRETARLNAYDPLIQADFQQATDANWFGYLASDVMWSPGWRADVLRVTTFIGSDGRTPEAAGWRKVALLDNSLARWERNPRLPDAYVVGNVDMTSFDGIMGLLSDDASDFTGTVHLEDTANVRRAFANRTNASPVGTVIEGGIGEHGRARFRVSAEAPAALVVSVAWLDGWSATVNGRSVPLARANGLVVAVPIEAGTSEVRLTFTPPGLRLGTAIAAVSVVMFLVITVWLRQRRRTATSPPRLTTRT